MRNSLTNRHRAPGWPRPSVVNRAKVTLVGGVMLTTLLVPSSVVAVAAVSITVSSTNDVVNGDVSSVSALLANPGPDGISLREAIEATNNSPGTYAINFAASLAGSTISLSTQLPPLTGGGVSISGVAGGNVAAVTINKAPTFVWNGACPSDQGCAFSLDSSNNSVSGLTLDGFGVGVDIDPLPTSNTKLATHQTMNNNSVSNMVMRNIQEFGVIMGSMYVSGCGLYGGSASPCQTDDTWTNTTVTGNTISTMDAGVLVRDSGAGNTFSGIKFTNNTIMVQGTDTGIGLDIGSNATGTTITGGLIAQNTISGESDIGIDVGAGANRATGNSVTSIQVIDNSITLQGSDPSTCCQGIVVFAGTDAPSAIFPTVLPLGYPNGNSVSNIVVQGNDVRGTLTTGIQVVAGLGAGGSSNHVSDVTLANNIVTSSTNATGLWIVTGGGGPPVGNQIQTANEISNVTLTANRVSTGPTPVEPSGGYAAVFIDAGDAWAATNTITGIQLVNNIISSSTNAVELLAGSGKGTATGNVLENVKLVNDTVLDPGGTVFQVQSNLGGSTDNVVHGVKMVNCILWGPMSARPPATSVNYSLTQPASLARKNHNVAGNPRFVNAASGNFGLAKNSPARAKGTAIGTPQTDINGRVRPKAHVDIGAVQSS